MEELIQQCKQNNIKAQKEVYQLFSGKLFVLCLKYSRNRMDAEDVLQDSFIKIFDKINQYKGKGSFEGWLKKIVINTALQQYRSKSPLQLVNSDKNIEYNEEVLLEIDDSSVGIDFLLELVQGLPDRYRMVFNLYVLDNYSHKEVAEILGISEGTSKSNLSRARLILKGEIQDYYELLEKA